MHIWTNNNQSQRNLSIQKERCQSTSGQGNRGTNCRSSWTRLCHLWILAWIIIKPSKEMSLGKSISRNRPFSHTSIHFESWRTWSFISLIEVWTRMSPKLKMAKPKMVKKQRLLILTKNLRKFSYLMFVYLFEFIVKCFQIHLPLRHVYSWTWCAT